MECFANSYWLKPLTTFVKRPIIDVWQCSEYTYVNAETKCNIVASVVIIVCLLQEDSWWFKGPKMILMHPENIKFR